MEEAAKKDSWSLFNRIAKRYDKINHLLSCGIDFYWRSCLVKRIPKSDQALLLDIACGTGDQLFAILKKHPHLLATGIDLSSEMLHIAKQKSARKGRAATFLIADAKSLPFKENSFDLATLSFGIRNIDEPVVSLKEMHRVLKKGGKALILEFSLPKVLWIRLPYLFYLRHVLPILGYLFSGDKKAYTYLSQTIQTFPYAGNFLKLMKEANFEHSAFYPLSLGIATLYVGIK